MWTIEQAFIEIDTIRNKLKKLSSSMTGYVKTSAIKNNLTTTSSGSVLDARQGKALDDKITDVYAGNTITISCRAAGYVTSSSKNLCITIPNFKPLPAGVTAGTMALTSLQVKGVSGTVAVTVADLTAIVYSITEQGFNIDITNTDESAFSVTNNTPIAVFIAGTITLS